MIDHESQYYDAIAKAVRAAVTDARCSPEKVSDLAYFPFFECVMMANPEDRDSRDLSNNENGARPMFQLDAYSNLSKGAKAQCKAMIAAAGTVLRSYGFARTYMTPETPPAVFGVTRYTARYEGLICE